MDFVVRYGTYVLGIRMRGLGGEAGAQVTAEAAFNRGGIGKRVTTAYYTGKC